MSIDPNRGHIPDLTLGWRLQMSLDYCGITSQQMADELGVARNTVSRWMHDVTEPKASTIKAWAMRTGVSVMWLLTGSGNGLPRLDSNQEPSGYQSTLPIAV